MRSAQPVRPPLPGADSPVLSHRRITVTRRRAGRNAAATETEHQYRCQVTLRDFIFVINTLTRPDLKASRRVPSAHDTRERRIAVGEDGADPLEVGIHLTELAHENIHCRCPSPLLGLRSGGGGLVEMVHTGPSGLRMNRSSFNATTYLGIPAPKREDLVHGIEPAAHVRIAIDPHRPVLRVRLADCNRAGLDGRRIPSVSGCLPVHLPVLVRHLDTGEPVIPGRIHRDPRSVNTVRGAGYRASRGVSLSTCPCSYAASTPASQ